MKYGLYRLSVISMDVSDGSISMIPVTFRRCNKLSSEFRFYAKAAAIAYDRDRLGSTAVHVWLILSFEPRQPRY